MNVPLPRRYPCYFMISPSPVECPEGLVCQQTGYRMFYIKFGDGIWDQYRYTTHNPSFTPGHTTECANIAGPNGARYYISLANNAAVRPGRFLEDAVLSNNFFRAIPGSGEWYKIRAPQNVDGKDDKTAQQLANDLRLISDHLDDPDTDFGFQAALTASNDNQQLDAQRTAATHAMIPHAQLFQQILAPYV